jgi:hypothetical protein
MMWDLDPRVREFLDENLGLPDWTLLIGLAAQGEGGTKRLIDQTIKQLNDAMGETMTQLRNITERAEKETKEYAEGSWPYPTLGGGTWFDSSVRRYSEAVTKTYQLRLLLADLVAVARHDGILPKIEKEG